MAELSLTCEFCGRIVSHLRVLWQNCVSPVSSVAELSRTCEFCGRIVSHLRVLWLVTHSRGRIVSHLRVLWLVTHSRGRIVVQVCRTSFEEGSSRHAFDVPETSLRMCEIPVRLRAGQVTTKSCDGEGNG